MAGDAVGEFDGAFAGGFDGDGAFEEEGLSDMGEVEVVVECRGGPYAPALEASVAELDVFAEVGVAAVLEVQLDVGEQIGPIALDGEEVVRAALDEALGEYLFG